MPPNHSQQPWLSMGRSLHRSASRRRFLQLSTATLSSIVLANCARNIADVGSSSPSTSSGTPGTRSPQDNTLYIYSWSTYLDDELLKTFEANTGIKVVADVYDSNETMLAKIQAGGGSAYSVIYPSDYMVSEMVGLDLLTLLDHSKLPATTDLLKQWQNPAYDPNNQHSFPYAWGTTGLVYNTEILDPDPSDWAYLWDQTEQLTRKITLLNDVREVFGMALKSLGYSNSTTNPQEIEVAYQKLKTLKPALNSFSTDGWRDQMVVGDLALSHAYSVDGIDVMTANPKLKYIIPASGATVWTDTIVIPKTAPNLEAAYAWLQYVLQPKSAAPIMERLKLAPPNHKTLEQLSTDLKSQTSLFPADEVLAKCEVLAPIGDTIDLYDQYWTELTSA